MSAYERIKLQVQEDIDQRKTLRTSSECDRFNFGMVSNGNAFTVNRVEQNSHESVTFRIAEKGIQVLDSKDHIFLEGVLTLGDDGECRLKAADKVLEFWQFRRAALEELFF